MVNLESIQAGNLASKNLIVFMQGWPDNHQMWDYIPWKDDLKEHRLLFIDFPNTKDKTTHRWGVDFPQMVEGIKQVLDRVEGVEKRTLVAHDWGCFYGYCFDKQYPKYFNQMIMMDVPGIVELNSLFSKLYVFIYQMILMVSFLIGGCIGGYVTRKMVSIFNHDPPYYNQITASRNYPYYYLHRNILTTIFRPHKRYLHDYLPSVPIVYLYGTKKPFQFHGPKWFKYLKDNQANGYELHVVESGHWFMKKFPKFIAELIARRVG